MARAPAAAVAEEPAPGPASLTPGMASLLRRETSAPEVEDPAPSGAESGWQRILRPLQASLVGADLVLVCLTLWSACHVRGRLGMLGTVLAVAALLCGAWLSCLALWLEDPQNSMPDL